MNAVVEMKEPTRTTGQYWDGMVLEVLDDSFIARLVDTTNPDEQEEAEILNASITHEADLALIRPGARFTWSIVLLAVPVSTIRFMRYPVWTKKEIHQAEVVADEISQLMGWST